MARIAPVTINVEFTVENAADQARLDALLAGSAIGWTSGSPVTTVRANENASAAPPAPASFGEAVQAVVETTRAYTAGQKSDEDQADA